MRITKIPIMLWIIFISIAVIHYIKTLNPFYLFNFTYVGSCLAIGIILFENKVKYSRNFVMLAIGCYLLVVLGLIKQENLLLSGFWYFLFLGVFEAAVIHTLVAKIAGPLIFGRGFCGYACWLAMVFDLLPYKKGTKERKSYGFIKYGLFVAILMVIVALYVFKVERFDEILFWMFILGNILYYVIGIALAFAFKDNRAFCKYVCPITVFLKPVSYFALLRIEVNENNCNDCKKCLIVCPMDVDILDNSRKRKNGTDCILCLECSKVCKQKAISTK